MFLRIREYYFNSWIFCHNATCQCADCLKKMFVWLARIFSATVPHVSLLFISSYHCKWLRVYIHTRSGRARDRVVSTGLFFSHMFFNRIMFYLNVCSWEVLIHYFFQEALRSWHYLRLPTFLMNAGQNAFKIIYYFGTGPVIG